MTPPPSLRRSVAGLAATSALALGVACVPYDPPWPGAAPDAAREAAVGVARQVSPASTGVEVSRATRRGDCVVAEFTWSGPGLVPHVALTKDDDRWRLHRFSTDADPFDVDNPAWGRTCA